MAYSTIRFGNEGGLARITLARPDHANSLDLTMMRGLMDAGAETLASELDSVLGTAWDEALEAYYGPSYAEKIYG